LAHQVLNAYQVIGIAHALTLFQCRCHEGRKRKMQNRVSPRSPPSTRVAIGCLLVLAGMKAPLSGAPLAAKLRTPGQRATIRPHGVLERVTSADDADFTIADPRSP
jgi:hypothetical protein